MIRLLAEVGETKVDLYALEEHGELSHLIQEDIAIDSHAIRALNEDLRWYFEDYPIAPVAKFAARANHIEEQVRQVRQKFIVALSRTGAEHQCELLVKSSPDSSMSPIPWEIIACQVEGGSFGIRSVSRLLSDRPMVVPYAHSGVIRVLAVISRPKGTSDIEYLLSFEPLRQTLKILRLDVDVVRPPTLEGLDRAVKRSKQEGRPYQVFHFDGHGSESPEDGLRLVFETNGGLPRPSNTIDVLDAFQGCFPPIVLLIACKSGVGLAAGKSLINTMLRNGAQSVIGMGYTILEDAARLFVPSFYSRLIAGESVDRSVTYAREQLRSRPARRSAHGIIDLADWIVPLHFTTGPSTIGQPAMEVGNDFQTSLASEEPFVGRDDVFQSIETGLRRHSVVLVSGIIGVGKTRLVREFSEWIIQTDLNFKQGECLEIDCTKGLAEVNEQLMSFKLNGGRGTEQSGYSRATGVKILILDDLPAAEADTIELIALIRNLLSEINGLTNVRVFGTTTDGNLWAGIGHHEILEGLSQINIDRLFGSVEQEKSRGENKETHPLAGNPDCIRRWMESGYSREIYQCNLSNRVKATIEKLSNADKRKITLLAATREFLDIQIIRHMLSLGADNSQSELASYESFDEKDWTNALDRWCTIGLARRIDHRLYSLHPDVPMVVRGSWDKLAPGQSYEALRSRYESALITLALQLSFKLAVGLGVAEGRRLPFAMKVLDPEYLKKSIRAYYAELVPIVKSAIQQGALGYACMTVDFFLLAWQDKGIVPDCISTCEAFLELLNQTRSLEARGADGTLRLLALQILATHASPSSAMAIAEQCCELVRIVAKEPGEHEQERAVLFGRVQGIALDRAGRQKEAEQVIGEALQRARKLGKGETIALCVNSLSVVKARRGDIIASGNLQWELDSEKPFGPGTEEELMHVKAVARFERGDVEAAKELQLQILASADGSLRSKARAMHELGLIESSLGNANEALDWLRRALSAKKTLGDELFMITTVSQLAEESAQRGDLVEAQEWLREAIRLGDGRDSPESVARGYFRLANISHSLGDRRASVEHLVEGLTLVDSCYHQSFSKTFRGISEIVCDSDLATVTDEWRRQKRSEMPRGAAVGVSNVLLTAGRGDMGKVWAKSLVDRVNEEAPSIEDIEAYKLLSQCLASSGDIRGATSACEHAVSLCERLSAVGVDVAEGYAETLRGLAALRAGTGERQAAVAPLDDAIRIHKGRLPQTVSASHALLGHCLEMQSMLRRDLGDLDGSIEASQECIRIFRALFDLNADYASWLLRAMFFCAGTHLRRGDASAAASEAERVSDFLLSSIPRGEWFDLEPKYDEVALFRTQCYSDLGLPETCNEVLEECFESLERAVAAGDSSLSGRFAKIALYLVVTLCRTNHRVHAEAILKRITDRVGGQVRLASTEAGDVCHVAEQCAVALIRTESELLPRVLSLLDALAAPESKGQVEATKIKINAIQKGRGKPI
ncbi:MAG: CHAT domain-containing protein [Ignavibacteriae bacterium]|nr:CHAT domain-containing protein [Ignavibacteriota bacterium]